MGSARPDLTVDTESLKHHFSLYLILPKIQEELFLVRIFLPDPL